VVHKARRSARSYSPWQLTWPRIVDAIIERIWSWTSLGGGAGVVFFRTNIAGPHGLICGEISAAEAPRSIYWKESLMSSFTTSRQFARLPTEVFAAISDPNRLARWWGPNGFTNKFDIFEFRPGGKWVFSMIGPDGKNYPNESVFKSIEPGKQVVIEHLSQPHFTLTISLRPTSSGTMLSWEQAFADASVANAIRHIAVPANEQNLDRLAAELGA
jgi:uncharacterized protein YndB with AHSA1/START domain